MWDFYMRKKFPDDAISMSPALSADPFMQRSVAEQFSQMSLLMTFRSVSEPRLPLTPVCHLALFFVLYFQRLESGRSGAESRFQRVSSQPTLCACAALVKRGQSARNGRLSLSSPPIKLEFWLSLAEVADHTEVTAEKTSWKQQPVIIVFSLISFRAR